MDGDKSVQSLLCQANTAGKSRRLGWPLMMVIDSVGGVGDLDLITDDNRSLVWVDGAPIEVARIFRQRQKDVTVCRSMPVPSVTTVGQMNGTSAVVRVVAESEYGHQSDPQVFVG